MSDRPIHPRLDEVERQVCDLVAEQLGVARAKVTPASRLIEDLRCDSLDAVELMLAVEERFGVTLPDGESDPVYKTVFTRAPFRLRDFAELVCLRWHSGPPERSGWRRRAPASPVMAGPSFSQLGAKADDAAGRDQPLHEALGPNAAGLKQYRRRTDGMRCVQLPAARVTIGSEKGSDTPRDEQPRHRVSIGSFVIDTEPVSTSAYARFLNSIGPVDDPTLRRWFLLSPEDHRHEHELLEREGDGWRPLPGAETWPMILVSWYGASAYSLWANGLDWREYERDCRLPTEAQWEYAARGAEPQRYPWGDREPRQAEAVYGQHVRGRGYAVSELPLAPVNAEQGMSPHGLHHMAGNVWQWCRDSYDPVFYASPDAVRDDPCNVTNTGIKSERGGSWIGPASLIRSSFRRGRAPEARGRCLGFRCVSEQVNP